ncbi:Hypothetical protein MexAM1_META1p1592 [Methylorubrum extorquens AM1]|uniref:Membrane-associated sensor domain-containing protein n=1 Tax=Methylorubrum extorquens (strain ATCC 14718 / DSM 1338 / JCM 2805 / NCIMB 9133 / AM1) TaxID=272630 RepID=C5B0A1_METEA|nr:Hypothetical protein MexAM1_META1p1592 [Methylorubrum extorquens AM1]
MHATWADSTLETLATARAGLRQRLLAGLVSLVFGAVTLALLPFANLPIPPMLGFVPVYQSALVVVYGLTTFLFLTQYRRTRSASLLVLGTGSLYVTLVVFLQMLSFPNVLAPGRILGSGPDTTTWLWTFWHVGPPLCALPYAILEGDGRSRTVAPARAAAVALLAMAATVAAAALTAVVVTRYVHLLPKCVEGDDYWLLTTSGVGPAVVALTVLALAVLCWTTRLRTVLQLWLAVSLLLLVFDNMITLPGAARSAGSRGGWRRSSRASSCWASTYARSTSCTPAPRPPHRSARRGGRSCSWRATTSPSRSKRPRWAIGSSTCAPVPRAGPRGTTRSSATASRSSAGTSRPFSGMWCRKTGTLSGPRSKAWAGAGASTSTAASAAPATARSDGLRYGARPTATRPIKPGRWPASSWTPHVSTRPRSGSTRPRRWRPSAS